MQTIKASTSSRTRKLTLVALGTALALVTNYLLIPAENVKFMDLIVFIIGFVGGPLAGAATGALTWSVYGAINPNGGVFLPVWVSTMFGETFYGTMGGFLGRRLSIWTGAQPKYRLNVLFGLVGLGLTFAYDMLTSLAHAFAFGLSLSPAPFAIFLLFSAPFLIAHELSNLAFFSVLGVRAVRALTGWNLRQR